MRPMRWRGSARPGSCIASASLCSRRAPHGGQTKSKSAPYSRSGCATFTSQARSRPVGHGHATQIGPPCARADIGHFSAERYRALDFEATRALPHEAGRPSRRIVCPPARPAGSLAVLGPLAQRTTLRGHSTRYQLRVLPHTRASRLTVPLLSRESVYVSPFCERVVSA